MIVLTAAAVAAGAVLVAAVGWDIALTVLHPGARGPISYRANRAAWAMVRVVSVRHDSRRLLSYGGPVAMGANVVTWMTLLWLGFALVYLPFEATYDALYISGSRSRRSASATSWPKPTRFVPSAPSSRAPAWVPSPLRSPTSSRSTRS